MREIITDVVERENSVVRKSDWRNILANRVTEQPVRRMLDGISPPVSKLLETEKPQPEPLQPVKVPIAPLETPAESYRPGDVVRPFAAQEFSLVSALPGGSSSEISSIFSSQNIFAKFQKLSVFQKLADKFDRYSKEQLALAFAGIIVFIIGITASMVSFRTNSHVTAQAGQSQNQGQPAVFTGDNPEETPPNDTNTYQVPADYPKRIRIDKLQVNALVRALGTKPNNELLAPSNIYDAGWYKTSAKPGEHGSMLIDGHVHGPTKPGVFANLKNLTAGDRVQVERGDGKVFSYRVVKTQSYAVDKVDMTAAMVPVEAGKPGLNLITCAGKYDPKTKQYDQRVIVFASLID